MKKNLLLVSFLMASVCASAQTNWLINGDFETPDKALGEVVGESNLPSAVKGDWTVYTIDEATQALFSATIEATGDEEHGYAAQLAFTGKPSWWKACLMQRIKYPLAAEEYKLEFDAKLVSGFAKVSTLLYLGANYAVKTDYVDPTEKPTWSGARYDNNVNATSWTHISVSYDFSRTVNNINSYGSVGDKLVIAEATKEELADARLIFMSNANISTVLIDNVKLVPVDPNTKPVDPTNIESAANENFKVYAADGSVQIEGLENANIAIYGINGSLIEQVNGVNGTMNHALPQGSYIVKIVSATTTQTAKVLVK